MTDAQVSGPPSKPWMILEVAQPVVGLSYQVLDAVDGGRPVVGDELGRQRGEAPPFGCGEGAGEPGVAVGDGVAHAVQGGTARLGQGQRVGAAVGRVAGADDMARLLEPIGRLAEGVRLMPSRWARSCCEGASSSAGMSSTTNSRDYGPSCMA